MSILSDSSSLRLQGSFGFEQAQLLSETLQEQLNLKLLQVDLRGVTQMDFAVLQVLVSARHSCQAFGQSLKLIGPNLKLQRDIEQLGLAVILKLETI